MIPYCIIYIPFILSSIFDFDRTSENTKRKIVWLWVCILTVFWGIRWNCGTDWDNFYDVFQGSDLSNIFTFTRGMAEPIEPGYVLLNALVKSVGGNYSCFLFVFSFLILYCLARISFKFTSYPLISFIYLVISLGVIFPSRQALAMGISSYAIPFLIKRRFIKYCFPILIGATIHISTLLLLPFYFINPSKVGKWLIGGLYILSFSLGNWLPSIIGSVLNLNLLGPLISIRLNSYSQTVSSIDEDFSSRGTMSIMLSLMFLLYFMVKKYYNDRGKLLSYSFHGFLAMEMIRNIFMQTMRDLMRLELFFRPYAAILYAVSFGELKYGKYKYVSYLVFILLMFYYFFKMLTGVFSTEYLPYKTIF